VGLVLFRNFSNILEWGGISKALDPFEDFVELLMPILWFMLIYSYLKELATDDLKKSKRSLQESETRFRQLADLLPQTVFETNTEGRLTYVNQFGFQTFGYTDEVFQIESKALNMLIPEQRDIAGRRISRIMAGENLPEKEYTALRKNGTTFPVIIYSNQIRRGEETVGLRGIIVDITERKRAEADRERLLSAIEQVAETIVITDADGHIQYANPAFDEVTGYSRKEVIGKNPRILKSGKHDKSFYRQMWQIITAGNTWRGRLINRKKDGTFYTEEASISPVHDGVGEIVNFVAVKRNITDEIRMEEKLRQAQKMESIGTLAGGIAHDFNNILFPLLGYAEMLKLDLPVDSPLHSYIDEILHAALRSKDLVKQILTFSRRDDQNKEPIKLQPIVKEAIKLLRSSIPTTIDIQQDIADCRVVVADPTQINQIVMNLATNAYHAMEKTGGKLTINLKEIALAAEDLKDPAMIPGKYVCLTVADTGHGIDQEIINRIYDPYFTTKETGKGTGLGLSIIHGIVKSHGGYISAYSEPGNGAEFKVYLPLIKEQKETGKVETDMPIQKGDERILLVDDEDIVVQMVKQMLERLGYHVTARTSSVEALETFRAKLDTFDLIITDMTMPNMTGDKLAAEIMKIRSDIPVILCTGFSEMMSKEKAASLGIKGFLMKPVVIKDLSCTIRKLLDKKKS